MAEQAPAYVARGVRVVAVSADPPDVARDLKSTLGVPFHFLSDEEQRLTIELCGVNAHCEIIADGGGIVRWGGLSDNWRERLRPELVLQAAYRLTRP